MLLGAMVVWAETWPAIYMNVKFELNINIKFLLVIIFMYRLFLVFFINKNFIKLNISSQ